MKTTLLLRMGIAEHQQQQQKRSHKQSSKQNGENDSVFGISTYLGSDYGPESVLCLEYVSDFYFAYKFENYQDPVLIIVIIIVIVLQLTRMDLEFSFPV